jgi:chaperonin cofactor prefoldin
MVGQDLKLPTSFPGAFIEDLEPEVVRDPTMPQHRPDSNDGPDLPGKEPLETDAGTIPLEEMKMTYSQALVRHAMSSENDNSHSPDTADLLGFTKVENPHRLRGAALLDNLVPARNTSLPPPTIDEEVDLSEDRPYMMTEFSQSRDDLHMLRRKNSGQEMRLMRELDELRLKVHSLTMRAEIAEEKAERAESKIGELKNNVHSTFAEVEKDTDTLAGELDRIQSENSSLKEQLRDAQSHIFSLQPYRKELTPEEVGRVSLPRFRFFFPSFS